MQLARAIEMRKSLAWQFGLEYSVGIFVMDPGLTIFWLHVKVQRLYYH